MADICDFYEVTFFPMPHVTPRAARLSAHEDRDSHSGEKCIVLHTPLGIMKLYPKLKSVYKDQDTPK